MAKDQAPEPAETERLRTRRRDSDAPPASTAPHAAAAPDAARRPSPVEYRPWRGDGIVGDRHTD